MTIRDLWKTLLARLRVRARREPEVLFYWCPVANVAQTRKYGPKGAGTRRGTKHFKPGAKVYYIDAYWGFGAESVTVVGYHRGSRRPVTVTMRSEHLTNWRVDRTYHPRIIRELQQRGPLGAFGPGSAEGKREAERIAAAFRSQRPAR